VFSYSDIENCLKEDAMSEDIKSLVFLNCGAKLDFTQYWFNQRETDIKTFIFDSQRPVSHNNVLSQKAVYVVDFGDINVEECPEDEDLDVMEQEMEGEGDDDVVDGEKEYEKIINGGKDKREHKEDHKQSENEGEGNDEDEFDTDLIGKKRKRDTETDQDAKNDKKKRLMRVANYYSGSYYSKCCSYLVYQLGVQLNKQSVDSFWLWILGLTDQLVHSKISSIQYDEEFSQCHKDFVSITGKNFDQENTTEASNQNDVTNDKAFDKKGMFYSHVDLSSENIKVGSILPSQEFRFMFLRSWTLYKSVFYSNYVVSKLKLWEDMGKRELNRFFAMLGIPAEEYNQQYKFMNQKFKDVLKDKIPAIAKQFDLDHILFSSFVRQIDHKTQLNASDMVYAITSLLESPKSVMVDNIPQLDEVAQPSTAEEEQKQFSLNQQDYRDRQVENFWAAYNALDIKNKAYID
jgi:cell division control protein 45